jgi:hypothetical protein
MVSERSRPALIKAGTTVRYRRSDKEGWFAPEAGHEDLARYGSLDVTVAFIECRLGR